MKLILDENKAITGVISLSSGNQGIDYDGATPDNFEINFKPGYYLLQKNEIVVNPNYEEPSIEIPTPEPSGTSPEMLAINALGVQVAKLMSEKGGV